MAKQKIELWNLFNVGVIVPGRTGIVYTNQTGGVLCHHPEQEGFYVPLNRPTVIGAYEGEYDDIDYLDDYVLQGLATRNDIRITKLGGKYKKMSEEAWWWVKINGEKGYHRHPLQNIFNRAVILTYPNSD